MFGSTNKTSLFGTQTTNASAFGAPAGFGAVSSTPGTTFGALQTQPQQNSLFGGTSTAFGSTGGTGLFGTQQPSIFGSTGTQSTPGFGSGGTSTFGSTSTSLFGTPSTSTQSLFGASKFGSTLGSPFGSTTTQPTVMQQAPVGTTIKFTPLVGSDTMLKNGVNTNISTHHQCITCMREYETKSLEELRFEDYQANRKGPQVGTVFGSTAGTSLFNPSTSVSFNTGSSGGLFGAGKTTFGTTPTTTSTTSIFNPSFNKPVGFSATGTSPFGAVQPQQQQTSIFGQTSTSSFTSPNFFSGTQNNAQKSVFGATTTQPSLFNTSTTNTGLGKTNLFGNQTQSFTGFSFNPTTTSTSLFSSQPSLFSGTANTTTANKTPMFSFPSQPLGVQQPTSLGGVTGTGPSLFNTGGNLFSTGTSMFNTGANMGTSLFSGTSLPPTQNQASPMSLQQLSASTQPSNTDLLLGRLQVLPYGNSPLFQNNLKNPPSSPLKFTTDPKTLSQYKVNFQNSSSQKLPRSPTVMNKNVSLLFDGLEDENPDDKKTALDIFVPRKNVKKLVLKSKENINKNNSELSDSIKLPSPEPINSLPQINLRSSLNESFSKDTPAETTMRDFFKGNENSDKRKNSDTFKVASHLNISGSSLPDDDEVSDSIGLSVRTPPPSKCGVILTRSDYYTIPSLQELESLYDPVNDTCIVDKFTVGRQDYGSIYWEGPFDVIGLNLDEIVHIRRKEVIVYPDDDCKPQIGKGLNRPAQITLHQVWPVDKTTHEIIRDADRLRTMKYAEKVENATVKLGATFKEYRPDTGTWVFTVKHFSKYGLLDEDEEGEKGTEKTTVDEAMEDVGSQGVNNTIKFRSGQEFDRQSFAEQYKENEPLNSCEQVPLRSFDGGEKEIKLFHPFSEKEKRLSKVDEIEDIIKEELLLPTVPDKYTLMRSVMFDEEDEEIDISIRVPRKSKKITHLYEPSISESLMKPVVIEKPASRTKRDIVFNAVLFPLQNKVVCDISAFCCTPVCRVNFFNGTNNYITTNGGKITVNRLNLIPEVSNDDLRFDIQLKEQSYLISSTNEIPFIETRKLTSNPYNIRHLEKLVKACFAEVTMQDEYGRQQERLNHIIDWLCDRNKAFKKPKNVLQCILFYLAANDVKNAIDIALKGKYANLALLLCSGDNVYNKEVLLMQLDSWKQSRADEHIDEDLLKLYILLAGSIKWQLSSGKEIDVLENLTWTQQLALMLLYMTHNGLSDCVSSLTAKTNDVEYHILSEHSPWITLSAAENELEAWFLHQSLQSYDVISNCKESDVLHGMLAASLISRSVQWACFVACHIRDDIMREHAINEIISRSAPYLTESEEKWLINSLLIGKYYLAKAKAIYYKSRFDYPKAAVHMLECGDWFESHCILMEHIFPELVINDQLDVLRELIDKLKAHSDIIPDWFINGAHIYEVYCDVVQNKTIGDTPITFNIHMMKCTNKRQVLCQSEMARKVSLLQLELTGGNFSLNTPIPDDYVLKELKHNCRNLLQELSK